MLTFFMSAEDEYSRKSLLAIGPLSCPKASLPTRPFSRSRSMQKQPKIPVPAPSLGNAIDRILVCRVAQE